METLRVSRERRKVQFHEQLSLIRTNKLLNSICPDYPAYVSCGMISIGNLERGHREKKV